jgi:hypothetical protein
MGATPPVIVTVNEYGLPTQASGQAAVLVIFTGSPTPIVAKM